MKASELIALLRQEPDAEMVIAIHQYNKAYPIAYVPVTHFSAYGNRIYCHLPDDMYTVERKAKA